MSRGGKIWVVVAVVAVVLAGGAGAYWWFSPQAEPWTLPDGSAPYIPGADFASSYALGLDEDGTVLLAFHRDATVRRLESSAGESLYPLGEVPGIATVAPDGTVTVLREPARGDEDAWTFAGGGIDHGRIAVAFETVADAPAAGEKFVFNYDDMRLDEVAQGTAADGVIALPFPTFDGVPLSSADTYGVYSTGAYVVMGAQTGEGGDEGDNVYVIDAATGVATAAQARSVYPVALDLCAENGPRFLVPDTLAGMDDGVVDMRLMEVADSGEIS